jgi:ubiquinone/menaquinone biosynthesis C-methylase UbiE
LITNVDLDAYQQYQKSFKREKAQNLLHLAGHLWSRDRAGVVRSFYRQLLKREADESGVAHYVAGVRRSRPLWWWKWKMFKDMSQSIESRMRVAESVFGMSMGEGHHRARMLWVEGLPPAKKILDLGGSSSYDVDGSLYALGYEHAAEELTIIDFPPQDRVASSKSKLVEDTHTGRRGTQIRFVYDSFVNLAPYASAAYDMIMGGQVIEHVTQEEAMAVLKEAFRLLRSGGELHLDTPNRRITKLMNGGYIHLEHKIEYHVEELRGMALAAGFRLKGEGGISPMPVTCEKGYFFPHEIIKNIALTPDPTLGYSFYLALVKP